MLVTRDSLQPVNYGLGGSACVDISCVNMHALVGIVQLRNAV
jgi:hypothetical protein